MRFFLLALTVLLSFSAFSQIITPAYVVSNSHKGIKKVVEEQRQAYRDFKTTSITTYNRQGFPTSKVEIDAAGQETEITYDYSVNESDSTLKVIINKVTAKGQQKVESYNYLFQNGTLWEWRPVEGNNPVTSYTHYQYDENWNLVGKDIIKVVGADSSIVEGYSYSVQTDVNNRLALTNHTNYDMQTSYYYDEAGKLLSTSVFDGQSRRSTRHRVYNDEGQVELTISILNRGGALLGMSRYAYKTYRKGKPGIFETWMPVEHYESVMKER